MKNICKNLIAVLLMGCVVLLPVVAKAETFCRVRVTVNGQTQTFEVPIEDAVSLTRTLRFTFTSNAGKWVLAESPRTQKPTPKKPKPSTTPKDEEPTDTNTKATKAFTSDEKKMFDLVNAERKKAGLLPLKVDMRLVDVSRKKSKDMIDNKYFSHTSPTYGSPFDMLKKSGISYKYAGENLAGSSDVERAHTNLMNSPGHRRNILNPNYTHIGIGVVNGGAYGKMYTQTFIGVE